MCAWMVISGSCLCRFFVVVSWDVRGERWDGRLSSRRPLAMTTRLAPMSASTASQSDALPVIVRHEEHHLDTQRDRDVLPQHVRGVRS